VSHSPKRSPRQARISFSARVAPPGSAAAGYVTGQTIVVDGGLTIT
jgi:NAD(P)-dependent dehydrogenase (short-subunit alcohol dehydrogenase family)